MISVSESVEIERSVADVFRAAADPFEQLKWDAQGLKSVEQLTPEPLGKGTRYRGTARGPTGMMEFDYEFAEFEPDRKFVHVSSLPFGEGRHIFAFEAVPGGTHVTQTMQVEPKGFFRLIAPLLKRVLRSRLRQINQGLQGYLNQP